MSEQPGSSSVPSKSSRWRSPWLWVALALGAVAVYAAVGFWVVPRVARAQIVSMCRDVLGREATIGVVRFNPFRLAGVLEDFELRDLDGAELLRCDRLTVDFQASSLFRWAWTFREILVEGPEVVARILRDGRPSIADLFERPRDPEVRDEPFEIPRVLVGRLAMISGTARFVDQSRAPEFQLALEPLDLEVLDLTTIPDESGDHKLVLGVGKDGRLSWDGTQQIEPLELTGKIELQGVPLERIWDWLDPIPALDLVRGRSEVQLGYDVRRDDAGRFHVELLDGGVTATDLAIRAAYGGEDWLTVPRAQLSGIALHWPESTVEIAAARLENPVVLAWLGEDRRDNWSGALQSSAPAEPDGSPWSWRLGTAEVSGGTVRFEDRSVAPPVPVAVTALTLRAEGLTQELAKPVAVQGTATVNGSAAARFDGEAVPKPFDARLRVEVKGLDVTPFEPYAVLFPGADLRAGTLGVEGQVRLVADGEPALRFEGVADAAGFDLANPEGLSVLAFRGLRAEGVQLTAVPESLRVRNVVIEGGFAKVKIDEAGNLNLAELTQATEGDRVAGAAAEERTVPVEISRIELRDGSIDFTDLSLILDFATKIHSATGAIRDLSTVSAAPTTLEIEGRVADTGYFSTDGTVRIADPFASTDVSVVFRSLELRDLTPYSVEFAGYRIERGTLDLDIHYRIADRKLVGDHRVVATDLTLGEKVGGTAAGLPVRLAVALLKDKHGRIDLEVPVEGTVDSPEFVYRKVFWQAFKKILGNAAKAPFRAIGRLFGREDHDLSRVGFPPGSSDLLPVDRETLPKIAAELAPRSELRLEIVGRYDPVTDSEALAQRNLEAALDRNRAIVEAQAEASGRPAGELGLEGLYAERFGAERLSAERARFEPAIPEVPAPPPEPAVKKRKRKQEEAVAPPPVLGEFDAAGFYDALRAELLRSFAATTPELEALGAARAAAIVSAVTAGGGVEPSRVIVQPAAAVQEKREGAEVVETEMSITAGDLPEDSEGAGEAP